MASGGTPRSRLISTTTNCVICCNESDFFCVGSCGHPVCFECGTRIRVICQSKECPICRNESEEVGLCVLFGPIHACPPRNLKVVLVADPSVGFQSASQGSNLIRDARGGKYGIHFSSKAALDAFLDMLAHVCTVCSKEPDFPTFHDLQVHMRREHELFYCDLCETLNLFSWERKCYKRKELAHHRRLGDADDRSHRGHPLCTFCDSRFLDNDHLYRHLRRDHFYCHFCDADGVNHFYDTYDELKDHFRDSHFLCEEGNCRLDQFTPAFRTEIDLKGHKTAMHSKEMMKAQKRQERTINLEFNYERANEHRGQLPDTFSQRGRGSYDREGRGGRRGHRDQRSSPQFGRDLDSTQEEIVQIEGGASKISTVIRIPGRRPNPKRPENGPSMDANQSSADPSFQVESQDFPTLGGGFSSDGFRNFAGWNRRPGYQRARSGSVGEGDFPSLHGDSSLAMAKKEQSSQPSSPKSAKKKPGVVLIDDDEAFPSITKTTKEAKSKKSEGEFFRDILSASGQENGSMALEERKEAPKAPSLFETLTSGAWGSSTNKPRTLGQAAMTLSNDAEFPTLGGRGKLKGQREARPTTIARTQAQSVWSKATSTEQHKDTKTKKNQEKKKAEDAQQQKKKQMDNLVTLPASKTKARRVAQQKQRPSSESQSTEDSAKEDGSMLGGLPPGLGPPGLAEGAVGGGPPPGLDLPQPHPQPLVEEHMHEHFHGKYLKPSNFSERNRKLFDRISASLQGLQIGDFKTFSGLFRRGEMGPKQYHDEIRNLLGDGVFQEVFPELMALLPDIKRQRGLLEAHKKELVKMGKGGKKKSGAWSKGILAEDSVGEFRICKYCAQVTREWDFMEHLQSHELDQDYPALG